MPEDEAGRPGLRRALLGRPSRAQLVVALLLAALGFAAVVQVRTNQRDDAYLGARRGDLVQLLDSLDAADDRLNRQSDELTSTRNRLQSDSERSQVAEEETRKEADNLAILAGTVGAQGPGITVTIRDADEAVTASTLLNAIEELRDAGAEAIQIDGTARVVAQSAFVDSDRRVVRVDGRVVRRPFVIDAIGAPQTLRQAVVFRGGLADQVEALGGEVDVTTSDRVEVTALAASRAAQYAQPAP